MENRDISLTIRLFGYPQFLLDNKPIKLGHKKTQALVAYLAVETSPNRINGVGKVNVASGRCTEEELESLFWPNSSSKRINSNVRKSLLEFSKAAGEGWILKDDRSIYLNTKSNIWVDVNQFAHLMRTWKAGMKDDTQTISILNELVSLYQGDFLSGFNLDDNAVFFDWQAFQAETFRLHMLWGLETLVHLYAIHGDYDTAIYHARRWLLIDPLNEGAHRALMRLYAESGQRVTALRQYELCRKRLRDELGVEAGNETTLLYEHIRSGSYAEVRAVGNTLSHEVLAFSKSEPAQEKPTGTVTFLFTDIEGSTQLWEHQPDAMQHAHARHEDIIRKVMVNYGGYVYKMIGDAFQIAFSTAPAAIEAAIAAQRALFKEPWEITGQIKVRMALHTGITEERGDDYVGPTLNRVARLLRAGYGGQVILNQTTYELVRDQLPKDIFLRDLGVHALKDLVHKEHIYQLISPDLPVDFPPLKTADESPIHLPSQVTVFIGREMELAKIASMLEDPACRLISLVGIGGCGKTRLAIQAASQCRAFTHGIFFVELASISNLDGIISKIAESINLSFYAPQGSGLSPEETRAQLLYYLVGREALLVLDNFEQLINWASFIREILSSAPGIKIIVTSRERLNIPGEWILELGGLPFPSTPDYDKILKHDAVQLFVKSVERIGLSSFTEDDWTAIARICQLVEGIPLALEMAAAWVKIMSFQEIAAGIQGNLDFLISSWVGIPERHKTIRAIFDYSWNLLTSKEQEVLIQLSIFQAGFTREAALEVALSPMHLLIALTDKSFLQNLSSRRFEIHPVLRQYAVEKLAAQPMIRMEAQLRYTQYFSEWLDQMYEKLKGSEQMSALNSLRIEAQNMLNAFRWLLEQHDFPRLQRVILAMILFYEMDDRRVQMQEVIYILGKMLSIMSPLPGGSPQDGLSLQPAVIYPDLYILVLASLQRFIGRSSGEWKQTFSMQHESIKVAQQLPDSQAKAFALLLDITGPGISSKSQLEIAEQCIVFFELHGDIWSIALAQLIAGDVASFGTREIGLAEGFYRASLEKFSRLGNDWGRAMCLTGLAEVECKVGHLDEANRMAFQSQEVYEMMNNQERKVFNQFILSEIAQARGALEEARDYLQSNLIYFARVGDEPGQRNCRERLAALGFG